MDELMGHEESRSKTARLRERYEEIQAAIEQNYSHKLIAAGLEKQGLKFSSQRSFETTWHRVKAEKRKQMEGTTKPTTAQAPVITKPDTNLSERKKHIPLPPETLAGKEKPSAEELKKFARKDIDLSQYE